MQHHTGVGHAGQHLVSRSRSASSRNCSLLMPTRSGFRNQGSRTKTGSSVAPARHAACSAGLSCTRSPCTQLTFLPSGTSPSAPSDGPQTLLAARWLMREMAGAYKQPVAMNAQTDLDAFVSTSGARDGIRNAAPDVQERQGWLHLSEPEQGACVWRWCRLVRHRPKLQSLLCGTVSDSASPG